MKQLRSFEDRLFVFVGDYIDRGPRSREVVDFLLDFGRQYNCVFLRGNHEQMMLDALAGGDMQLWLMNGGRDTIQSYEEGGKRFELPASHKTFYEETKMYHNEPDYFFVHGGIPSDQTIEQSLKNKDGLDEFLWMRSHLNTMSKPWEKTVVFGHTPRPHPIQEPKMIGIDTGCVYKRVGYGKLTAVKLPEQEFIQQSFVD